MFSCFELTGSLIKEHHTVFGTLFIKSGCKKVEDKRDWWKRTPKSRYEAKRQRREEIEARLFAVSAFQVMTSLQLTEAAPTEKPERNCDAGWWKWDKHGKHLHKY